MCMQGFKSVDKGAFINYERGGMGDLRGGDLKIFYTEKGGLEKLPEH